MSHFHDDEFRAAFPDEAPLLSPRDRWLARMAILGAAIAALVAFELTSEPAISVWLFCLKFGFGDFHNAVWLFRRDRFQSRRWINSLWHLAAGFYRIFFAALAFIIVVVLALAFFPAINQELLGGKGMAHETKVAGRVVVAMFFPAGICGALAVLWSLAARHKAWVGKVVSRARRTSVWPPSLAQAQGFEVNRARLVAVFSALFVWAATVFLGTRFLESFIGNSPFASILLCVALLISGAALLLSFRDYLLPRILAPSPSYCWPIVEEDEDPSFRIAPRMDR